MDERLVKRWKLLTLMLSNAAESLRSTEYFSECMRFIEQNEFELALDVLAHAGRKLHLGHDYWQTLKKSAEVMDLPHRVKEFKGMRYHALKSAQQAAPTDGSAAR